MITKLLFSLLTSSLLILTSAEGQSTGAIPPDFKSQEGILIIVKPEDKKTITGFEKTVDKHFKKHYTGKYEFATQKEVDSESRFQNKKIYRFSLKYKIRTAYELKTGLHGEQKAGWKEHVRFNLFDRESSIEYGSFAEGRTENETIQRTAKMLEGTYK